MVPGQGIRLPIMMGSTKQSFQKQNVARQAGYMAIFLKKLKEPFF
jgi:hypothetical protein